MSCVSNMFMWSSLYICVCHCVDGRGGDETDGPPGKNKKIKRPVPEGRCVHV